MKEREELTQPIRVMYEDLNGVNPPRFYTHYMSFSTLVPQRVFDSLISTPRLAMRLNAIQSYAQRGLDNMMSTGVVGVSIPALIDKLYEGYSEILLKQYKNARERIAYREMVSPWKYWFRARRDEVIRTTPDDRHWGHLSIRLHELRRVEALQYPEPRYYIPF